MFAGERPAGSRRRRPREVFVVRQVQAIVCAVLLTLGNVSLARDYSLDWKFLGILQPELGVSETHQPNFRWRRIRGIVSGPVMENMKAKVQVNLDWETGRFTVLDAFLDYTVPLGDWSLNFQGGQLYPKYMLDAQTFANTVNWATITTVPRLFERTQGFQTSVTWDRYQLTGGVFAGPQSFNDDNAVPNWLASFTTVQPAFDGRLWYYVGKDARGGTENPTGIWGAELTNLRLGRVVGEVAASGGRRFGADYWGYYVEAGYRFSPRTTLRGKVDWCDTNTNVPGSVRLRYTASLAQRLTPWMTSKWDLEYREWTDSFEALVQGDIRF